MSTTTKSITANYSWLDLKAGDVLSNANGKKTAVVENTGVSTYTGRMGVRVKVTDNTYATEPLEYWNVITVPQLKQRFPLLVANVRSTVTIADLTNEQLAQVLAALNGVDVATTVTRTN